MPSTRDPHRHAAASVRPWFLHLLLLGCGLFLIMPELAADTPAIEDSLASDQRSADDDADSEEEDSDEEFMIDPDDPAEAALIEAINKHRDLAGGDRRGRPSAAQLAEHFVASEQRFQNIIDEHSDTRAEGEAIYWRSECQRELDEFRAALEGYEVALARVGDGVRAAEIRLGLGRCHIALCDPDLAIPPLEKIRSDYTDFAEYPEALHQLGRALRDAGRYEEAKAVWDELRSGYPGSQAALTARKHADSLRPPRERLADWIPEYQELKKEYEKADRKSQRSALTLVREVLDKIGEVRAPEAEQFLLGLVRKEKGDVRAAAVGPLLKAGGPRSAEVLISKSDQFDGATLVALLGGLEARHLVRTKLRTFSDYLAAGGKPTLQNAAIGLYGRVGDAEAVRALVATIPEADSIEEVGIQQRRTVEQIGRRLRRLRLREGIEALGAIVTQSRQALLRRTIAAESIGFTHSRAAVDPLREALFDRSSEVASAAVESLGRLRAEEAAADIGKLLVDRRRDIPFLRAAVQALSRFDPTPAEDALLGLSATPDVPLRTLVVRALGKIHTEASLTRLVEALEDPAWQVRSAALDAVADRRKVVVVEGLVGLLEREEGALRPKIVERLIAHLGVDKGSDPRLWREYWEFAKKDFDESVSVAAAEGGSSQKTFVRKADPKAAREPSYFGVEIVSKRLAFIIDVSGSMAAEVTVPNDDGGTSTMRRIDLARDELIRAIGLLEKGTNFNIVKFDQTPVPLSKKLMRLSPKSVSRAKKFAKGLSPAGGTNIYDSLASVLKGGEVDTIYLLSDGAPSAGTYTEPRRILEEIARLNEASQVTIHTVALGFDSEFMRELAEQNQGAYVVAGR